MLVEHKQYHIDDCKDAPFSLFAHALINLILLIKPIGFECWINSIVQKDGLILLIELKDLGNPDTSPFIVLGEAIKGTKVMMQYHTPKYITGDKTFVEKEILYHANKVEDIVAIAKKIVTHLTTVKPVFTVVNDNQNVIQLRTTVKAILADSVDCSDIPPDF